MNLPYFKFNIHNWLTGSIQLLSPEEKGTFIDLCAMIWQENGELKVDVKLHRKLRISDTTLYDRIRTYTELDIMVYENDILSVKFITDQMTERKKVSEKNRENVKKRWKKESVDTERNIREEKRRDNTKEKNTKKKAGVPPARESISFSEMSEKFEEFWKLYERKGAKKLAKTAWGSLKPADWDRAIQSIPAYRAESPDKKYRKNAEGYLKHRFFDDVLERAENGEAIHGIPANSANQGGVPSLGISAEQLQQMHEDVRKYGVL